MSKPISFRIDDLLKKELEHKASENNVTLTAYLKKIVEKELKTEEWKKIEETRNKTNTQLDNLKEKSDETTLKILQNLEKIECESRESSLRDTFSYFNYAVYFIAILLCIFLIPSGYLFFKLIGMLP